MVMAPVGGLHQCLCTASRADRLPGSCIGDALPRRNGGLALLPQSGCPDRRPDWATFSPAFYGSSSSIFWRHGGCLLPRLRACRKGTYRAYEEGIAGMLTIIKVSLLGAALMLLEGCAGYLTSYQTPCVEGHVCECVRYTTVNRSWLDCRDYGRVKSRAY
jgi:hypothetical protein